VDTTKTITHVSLCAGYGGIDLGLGRAIPDLRTIAFSEIEAFACSNLVSKMEAGLLDAAPIWTNLKTFPWSEFRDRVDILSGGYPCQPFSAAGKRLGKDDPRHLWPWIADGIVSMRPRIVFFENVEGHISLGLREVIEDLERLGYNSTWGIFSAREVGAPHQRKRVFILAHRDGNGSSSGFSRQEQGHEGATGVSDNGSDQVWPSRPGQPQHGWEPPRVVGNAILHGHATSEISGSTSQSEAQGWVQELEGGSPSMGNTEHDGLLTEQIIRGDETTGNEWAKEESQQTGQPEGADRPADVPSLQGCTIGSESVGNSSDWSNGQQPTEQQGWNTSGRSSEESGAYNQLSQAQPSLGLYFNEFTYPLGETLTLNPYGDSVITYENISNKINAREVLLNVWRDAISQEIQWTNRGLQCLLAEKVLQSGMQLDSFTQRICHFIWCIQTSHEAKGWGLHGMWVYETFGDSSQRQKPIEQFQRELGYAMCQLSYEIALARGQDSVEGKSILQGVREFSERAWTLSEALPEMEEVWRSSLDQAVWENGCYVEATSIGNRTDELRLLGNGVVPATAERAFLILMDQLLNQ